jgi:hypothetical protein
MKKSEVTFEPATIEHAKEFYGDQYRKSFKGYSALIGGKVVGMGGLAYEKGQILLFSDMKDELRPHKKEIWKAIDILDDLVKKTKSPVVAVASNKEKRSEELLTKLGFSPTGHTVPEGKIYWRFPNG